MLKSTAVFIALGLLTGAWSRVVKRQAEEEGTSPLEGQGPPEFLVKGPPNFPAGSGPPNFPPGPPPSAEGGSECPTPATVESFDSERYVGDWYQSQGIPTFFQPSGTKCVRATYGKNDDGTISVRNVATKVDGSFTEICGYAEVTNPEKPGSLSVKFPLSPPGSYNLLGTDYDNFAAVYSCSNVPGLGKFEYGWVLTRSTTPTPEVIEAARQVFVTKGISLDKFENDDQSETCAYENADGSTCAKKQ